MPFEYDPAKSASNKLKHGIDFVEAQALWRNSKRLEADASTTHEVRRIMIGCIGLKLWTAVFTVRGDNIRLISVRRARDEEVERYEDDRS
jgi:uncharacterized DUF497 family protein